MSDFDLQAERRKRCDCLLTALMGKMNVKGWWNSPNLAFHGRTPDEQWAIDYTSVYDYLMNQLNGDYS
jgi:hypothetical protein